MNNKEILNELSKFLPSYLVNNSSFKEIFETFFNLSNEKLIGEVNKIIYNGSEKFKSADNLCSTPLKERVINLCTTEGDFIDLHYTDKYKITLSKTNELENDMYEIIQIIIFINEKVSTWKVVKTVEDENYYCYSFNSDFYSYNCEGEPLEIKDNNEVQDIEVVKDKDFSNYFGVPLENARKCRLNFNEYKDYINICRKELETKIIDDVRQRERNMFTIPFEITNFATFISGIKDNGEEYEEETEEYDETDDYDEREEYESTEEDTEEDTEEYEYLDLEEQYKRAYELQEALISNVGNEGEFVISLNMSSGIEEYLFDKDKILNTTGLIIRKLSNVFTVYHAHLSQKGIILIPHIATKEEIQKLYNKDPYNSCVYGLSEFFEVNKSYKLDK